MRNADSAPPAPSRDFVTAGSVLKLRKFNNESSHYITMIKKGDNVLILTGSNKGAKGAVEKILKSVNLFDLKDNLIRHFKSYKECAEYLNSPYSTIAYLIRKNKIYKKLFKFKINEE